MMRRFITCSVLVTAAVVGAAAAATDPFVAGNAAATSGKHADAASSFERTIAADGWSPGALLGLGNAYASEGEHGRAILAYERAAVLAPRDEAIRTNLAREREAAGVAVPAPSRLQAQLSRLTTDDWTWLAIAAAVLACAGLAAMAWTPRRHALMRGLVIAGGVVCGGAAAAAHTVAPSPSLAIAIHASTARIAPFGQAEPAFPVADGERVEVEDAHGDYVYVRAGDQAGWLPQAAIERVITDRRSSGA